MLRIVLTGLLILVPASGAAGWDCPENNSATMAYTGNSPVAAMVLPDGSGPALTSARLPDGTLVDATLTITVIDCLDMPIANYPAEDMWLQAADDGLVPCLGGTNADGPTDSSGRTTWTSPPRAGGASQARCLIMVNGQAMVANAGFDLHFNSPDINGDLLVDLRDVPYFAADFHGFNYNFRSDFYADSVLNLSDLSLFAGALGAHCP